MNNEMSKHFKLLKSHFITSGKVKLLDAQLFFDEFSSPSSSDWWLNISKEANRHEVNWLLKLNQQ